MIKNNDMTKTEQQDLKDYDQWINENLGSYDVEECYGESEKFDRRKFGKVECNFCKKEFNPFYQTTLKQTRDWQLVWCGIDHRYPEACYDVNCPSCKRRLFFTIYFPQ